MDFHHSPNPGSGYEAAQPDKRQDDVPAPTEVALKLLTKGFTTMEHRLLSGTVLLSRRRQPRLDLINDDQGQSADVVMIDGADTTAMNWALQQPWLRQKVVIWVDAPATSPSHITIRRPVQWTSLPIILARALEQTPQKTNATIAAPVSVLTSASTSSRQSVLVVDDSLAVRAYLRSLLEPRGFTVTDADSAEAGIAAAAANSYACILMDVLMPGIDGYEACRRIKARTRSGPAIVMLTSKSSPFDRIRGKMAGCDAYLTKPVDANTLQDVLSRYVAAPVAPVAPIKPIQAAPTSAIRAWASSRSTPGAS